MREIQQKPSWDGQRELAGLTGPKGSPDPGCGNAPDLSRPEVYDFEVGKSWAYLLSKCAFEPRQCVVEVAPGMSPKIGIGLSLHGFRGTLYVVEPCLQSLEAVVRRYSEILPEARIIPVDCRLSEAPVRLPRRVDGILSNHPLDDMLLGCLPIEDDKLQSFFVNNYIGPDHTRTANLWERLMRDQSFFAQCQDAVIADWRNAIAGLKPAWLGISQYQSYFFRSHGLEIPDREALVLLRRLAGELKAFDCSGEIQDESSPIVEAQRWLLLKFGTGTNFSFKFPQS